MSITAALQTIKTDIPNNVTLVAVSKTKPNHMLQEAYDFGQRDFGENKVQDLVDKHDTLPKDINWHFIGHLQTNKVKYIAPFIHLIHPVDSLKLLKEINKQALNNDRTIDVLLQFHIAEEDSKFGIKFDDLDSIFDNPTFFNLKNIRIIGVMGMATFTDNIQQVENEFSTLNNYFQILKSDKFKLSDYFTEISMGMSGDFKTAIKEGSTMVRVGSSIFGSR